MKVRDQQINAVSFFDEIEPIPNSSAVARLAGLAFGRHFDRGCDYLWAADDVAAQIGATNPYSRECF